MTMQIDHGHGNGIIARDALGGQVERRQETATAAQAAREQAAIQARFVMALQRPRMIDQVRLDLKKECSRPAFAEVARYEIKRGNKAITGWSIRFVEAAARCFRNLTLASTMLYDDDEKRVMRCSALDLETNAEWGDEITILKTVERRQLGQGQVPVGQRRNSFGDLVYIVEATDDDLRMKVGAAVSRSLRTLGLRLLPGDILDEAERWVAETIRRDVATDPEAARKRLVEAFAAVGVRPADLVEYLGGKPLDGLTVDDTVELKGVYAAIKDGVRWADMIAASPHRGEIEAPDEKAKSRLEQIQQKVRSGAEKLRAKAKSKTEAAPATEPAASSEQPPPEPAAEREPGQEG